jgi:ADP-ribose pyrophosphatase YjhB (NUDIX family)
LFNTRLKSFITKAWLLKFVTSAAAMITKNRLPPFPGAAAIIEQDNQLLLLERSDGLGFCLPGGIMRWNESIQDTLQREVKEETGYNIEILQPFKNYSGPQRDSRFSSLALVYTARILDGRLTPSNEGTPMWVPREEVLNLKLAFDAYEMITDYLALQED